MQLTSFFGRRSYSTGGNQYLAGLFSIENEEKCIARVGKMKIPRKVSGSAELSSRQAAVLVPLVTVNGMPGLLFTERSHLLNAHRGEVCYPGGKFDGGYDKLIEDAALRETEEELGISRELFKVWTKLPPLPSRDGKTFVTPVIASLQEPYNCSNLRLNPDEVQSVFTRSISSLCEGTNQGYTQFRSGYTLPVYFSHHKSEKPKIWGLTAVITHQVLSVLVPDLYKLKLRYVKKVTTN